MKRHLICLILAVLHLFSPNSFGSEVNLSDVSIRVVPKGSHRFSFQFCELGMCKDFGRPEGYDEAAFENMNSACLSKRRLNPLVSSVLSGLSFAALIGMTNGAGAVIFLIGQSTSLKMNQSIDQRSVRMTNDLMPALVRNRGSFEFLFDDFVALRNGLVFCHDYYESTPGVWLEDCNRDLNCKRNLALPLYWSDERIRRTHALEIYSLSREVQFSEEVYQNRFGESSSSSP